MTMTLKFQHIPLLLMLFNPIMLPAYASETEAAPPSSEEIRRETRELLQALKKYTADQREQALAKIESAQDSLDRRIERLEDDLARNWDRMDEAARDRARESLRALRQQRTEVAEYYGSLKSASSAAWGHIKQGFSSAYRDLHDAWQKAEGEFSADE